MMTEDTRPLVQVVAGILLDQNGRYLLSSRPEGKPYAGYWEFAGGKVEAGESDFQALQREFEEELGIRILAATPWLTKVHSYEHAHVRLHFLWVEADQLDRRNPIEGRAKMGMAKGRGFYRCADVASQ